jgi:hypothetical protein
VLGGYDGNYKNDVWYSSGLGIEETSIPNALRLQSKIYPNPFKTSVIIGYYLPKTTTLRLSVYNSSGQEVKLLFDGLQFTGFQKVQWNGRDDFGRTVPAGTYFLYINRDDFGEMRKIIKLR